MNETMRFVVVEPNVVVTCSVDHRVATVRFVLELLDRFTKPFIHMVNHISEEFSSIMPHADGLLIYMGIKKARPVHGLLTYPWRFFMIYDFFVKLSKVAANVFR